MGARDVPNLLTKVRLYFLTPLICATLLGAVYHNNALFGVVLGLSIVVIITDIIDGYLARKWDAITAWGAKMDPLADKFSTWPIFLYGLWRHGDHPWWNYYATAAAFLLVYDIVVTYVLWGQRGDGIVTNKFAKWKTGFLMVGLAVTLAAAWGEGYQFMHRIVPIGEGFSAIPLMDGLAVMLILAAGIFGVFSGIDYAIQWMKLDARPVVQPAE